MWGNCLQNGTILTFNCVTQLYKIVVNAALVFIGVTSVFLLIFAAIKFITSGGGKQVEEAKNIVTYAIIGLILVLLSFSIINFISNATNVPCILSFGFGNCK